jgi:hypothetical protein
MARFARLLVASALTLALAVPPSTVCAVTPAAKCAAAKSKAAAKKVGGKLKCYQKAFLAGTGVDGTCLTTVEGKFSQAITKAEQPGACVVTNDATAIEGAVDTCVNAINALTPVTTTVTTSTSSTTTTTLCAGASVGGSCWFKGAVAADCASTCVAQSLGYDLATKTFAGSDGTASNCALVAAALDPGSVFQGDDFGDGGIGCFILCGNICASPIRDTDPTTATATHAGVARYCACR